MGAKEIAISPVPVDKKADTDGCGRNDCRKGRGKRGKMG